MKITIRGTDDLSVGHYGELVEIEWPELPSLLNHDYRKALRERLKLFWRVELDDNGISVGFDDECEDCGKVLERSPVTKKFKKHECPY